MDTEAEIQEFIREGHKRYLPALSIDCAIFGYHERQLKVLLLKWKKLRGWSLPGGRILKEEGLQRSATRILSERTGLKNIFLQQFHLFGDSKYRKQSGTPEEAMRKFSIELPEGNWLLDRTLTVGYYALVEYSKVEPTADIFTEECRWWDIHKVPALLFDHNEVVKSALKTMQREIYHQPIGYNLLPEKFTLPEIHDLYETLLEKSLDRRNFPKKLLSLGIIKKLKEQRKIGPHRSPYLYRFDKEGYENALKDGIALAI